MDPGYSGVFSSYVNMPMDVPRGYYKVYVSAGDGDGNNNNNNFYYPSTVYLAINDPPSIPTPVTAVNNGGGNITLNWPYLGDPNGDWQYYLVHKIELRQYCYVTGSFFNRRTVCNTYDAGPTYTTYTNSYALSGLTIGTPATFAVKACDGYNFCSSFSSTVTITP